MRDSTIGVDLGGTKLLIVSDHHAERFDTGPHFSPDDLASALGSFIARLRLRPSRIGIAVPGLVDASGRVCACDVLPALTGWPAAQALAGLGGHVAVVNDVKAALLEEMHDAPAGLTGGVVMAGTAIGAAFVVDGRPMLGASGWAGELGYLPLSIGPEVRRLDELAGGAAIAARRGVAPAMLATLARAGESASLLAITEGGRALGLGLAAVINLLNPSRLAVGGGTLELPGYWEAAATAAQRYSIPELWRDCTLARVRAGAQVVALGAIRAAAT